MIKEQLGKRICELRKKSNLSQEDLAEKLDISQRSLSKIETGRNFLTAETLEKLLQAFEISPSELFDFEHIAPSEDLQNEIYKHIAIIKEDNNSLVTLYKITKTLAQK